MYLCIHVYTTHSWRSKDNLQESVFSFGSWELNCLLARMQALSLPNEPSRQSQNFHYEDHHFLSTSPLLQGLASSQDPTCTLYLGSQGLTESPQLPGLGDVQEHLQPLRSEVQFCAA